MTVAGVTRKGRLAALRLMRDECTITRPGDGETWDDATGTHLPGSTSTAYAGPCRVRRPNVAERDAVAGDADWTVTGVVVSIPVDGTTDDLLDATVTIVACEMDPTLTGRVFTVLAPHAQSQATARRLRCVEVARA